jgi:hypothetical protein
MQSACRGQHLLQVLKRQRQLLGIEPDSSDGLPRRGREFFCSFVCRALSASSRARCAAAMVGRESRAAVTRENHIAVFVVAPQVVGESAVQA